MLHAGSPDTERRQAGRPNIRPYSDSPPPLREATARGRELEVKLAEEGEFVMKAGRERSVEPQSDQQKKNLNENAPRGGREPHEL